MFYGIVSTVTLNFKWLPWSNTAESAHHHPLSDKHCLHWHIKGCGKSGSKLILFNLFLFLASFFYLRTISLQSLLFCVTLITIHCTKGNFGLRDLSCDLPPGGRYFKVSLQPVLDWTSPTVLITFLRSVWDHFVQASHFTDWDMEMDHGSAACYFFCLESSSSCHPCVLIFVSSRFWLGCHLVGPALSILTKTKTLLPGTP